MAKQKIICVAILFFMLALNFGCDSSAINAAIYSRPQRRVVSVPPGVAFNVLPSTDYKMERVPATIDMSKFSESFKNGQLVFIDPDEKVALTAGKVYVFIPGFRKETTDGKRVIFVNPGETKYIEHDCFYILAAGSNVKVPEDNKGNMHLLIGKDQYGRNTITEYPDKVINYQPPLEFGDVQMATPPKK